MKHWDIFLHNLFYFCNTWPILVKPIIFDLQHRNKNTISCVIRVYVCVCVILFLVRVQKILTNIEMNCVIFFSVSRVMRHDLRDKKCTCSRYIFWSNHNFLFPECLNSSRSSWRLSIVLRYMKQDVLGRANVFLYLFFMVCVSDIVDRF